jgi:hypothetical protein
MPAEDQNIKTLPLMTLIALIVTDGRIARNSLKEHGDEQDRNTKSEEAESGTSHAGRVTRRFAKDWRMALL